MSIVSGVYTSTKHLKPINKQALSSLSFAHGDRLIEEGDKEDCLIDEDPVDEFDPLLTDPVESSPCGPCEKLPPAWRPTEDDVAAFMRRGGLTPKDLCRKARKEFFPHV